MSPTIYLFSGLGADERVFRELDFTDYKPVFIRWITPEKNESIEAYAFRLTKQIPDEHPVLIGLSFGGMIAIEVAKHLSTSKVILIASAKTQKEIPGYYRFAGRLGLHHLLPARLMIRSKFITNWFFGASGRKEQELLRAILQSTDPVLLKWAIGKIVLWNNVVVPLNTVHIHGTKDRILPFRETNEIIPIEGGGHFMTLQQAEKITTIIRDNLKEFLKSP
ncbi:MAG: alpha/beta fold hydrolase [Candidatus Methylacidiphilales bacterium]|nr:alpha/beta hydrolase [Candidatus Methylacidiphilales bacterium]